VSTTPSPAPTRRMPCPRLLDGRLVDGLPGSDCRAVGVGLAHDEPAEFAPIRRQVDDQVVHGDHPDEAMEADYGESAHHVPSEQSESPSSSAPALLGMTGELIAPSILVSAGKPFPRPHRTRSLSMTILTSRLRSMMVSEPIPHYSTDNGRIVVDGLIWINAHA
jgi:hypothetical protein